jgi:hypothetical protein
MNDEEYLRNKWQLVTCYQLYGSSYRGPEKWAVNFGLEQFTVEGNKEQCLAAAREFTENRIEEVRQTKLDLVLLESYRIAVTEQLGDSVYIDSRLREDFVMMQVKEIVHLSRITQQINEYLVSISRYLKLDSPVLS